MQPKKPKTTQFIVVILLALTVYFFMKYPLFFIAGLVAILAVLVLLYFKAPKFKNWVKSKFKRKPKKMSDKELRQWYIDNGFVNGLGTAQERQASRIVSIKDITNLCKFPGCGGAIEPVQNFPKFFMCAKCGKVQSK